VTSKHQFRSIGAELLNCNDDSATSLHPVKRKHRSDLERISWVFLLHCFFAVVSVLFVLVLQISRNSTSWHFWMTLSPSNRKLPRRSELRINGKQVTDRSPPPTATMTWVTLRFSMQRAVYSALRQRRLLNCYVVCLESVVSVYDTEKSFPKNTAFQTVMHGVPNAFFASKVLSKCKGLA